MKSHKLYIDDLREVPDISWTVVRNSNTAIIMLDGLMQQGITVDSVSFDHDLGGDDTTRRVVIWMIENEYYPQSAIVHTANGVGREWLEGMIDRYFPEGTLQTKY
jgi:hypothetical protein